MSKTNKRLYTVLFTLGQIMPEICRKNDWILYLDNDLRVNQNKDIISLDLNKSWMRITIHLHHLINVESRFDPLPGFFDFDLILPLWFEKQFTVFVHEAFDRYKLEDETTHEVHIDFKNLSDFIDRIGGVEQLFAEEIATDDSHPTNV